MIAAALAVGLSACGDNGGTAETEEPVLDNATFKTRQAAADEPRQVLAEELFIRERSPTLQFSWHAPPEIAAHPRLLDRLRADARDSLAEMRENAREFAQRLVETGQDPRPLYFDQEWSLAYSSPTLLNLSAATERYDGGAHPNRYFDGVLWDRTENRAIELPALFVNWPTAREELETVYCRELDDMRRERRGQEIPDDADDEPFWQCPPLGEQTVVLDSGAGMRALNLKVLLPPYVAGPYAEGSYEIDIPLTEERRQLLKSAYLAN
ncbi:hypothetical protein B5C34_01205 [Pacificimonas flava]|uniref:Deacetylase PdaC domain-containing protein n=2 Tax=Pacificimonas TaxID=1960290 RepID=A0A219B1G7_9SPHN|nr:hypothetical protein B5C34_01205 [Pacificimonas flava]